MLINPLPTLPTLPDIPHTIQLSVAPVFLLSGIAGLLVVMTNRLARIIDRGRYFERNWDTLGPEARARAELEVSGLERRRVLASRAIRYCTLAALLVCVVVMVLFVQGLTQSPLGGLVALLFILAMLSLIIGLGTFLREVRLATHSIRMHWKPPVPSSAPAQAASPSPAGEPR